MKPFARSRPAAVALSFTALVLGAVGFLPLFDGPGYESALAAGLVVPSAVAITTALELRSPRAAPIDALARGLSYGVLFTFVVWLLVMAHGLRVGFCDPWRGTLLFVLGPLVGAMLAGAWGAFAGEIAGRLRRKNAQRVAAVLLAIAAPLGSALVSLVRFYTSPMVFAYDPFVGFFSGTLYDTIIDPVGLSSYRAGSVATLLGLTILSLHLGRDAMDRIVFRSPQRPGLTLLGVASFAASFVSIAQGYRSGHWHTSSTIAEQLGARLSGERCDVIYSRGLPLEAVQLFASDCDAYVIEQEAWFETKGPARITAYLFADSVQKASLMGAADTYVAKPWRREIYVQQGGYPHQVLGHEIAHVMAGSFGRGPFRIAGRLFGLVPNPGLIEGIAVAAAPHEGALSSTEWAKAMKDLKLLPPLSRLFALGFLGESSSVAYTVSGAFVGFIKERFGAAVLRDWYGGKDLPDLVGKPWDELEKAFLDDLDRVELKDAARAQAKARFERPGIFGRRCPHVVDACKKRADELAGRGDDEGAVEQLEKVLSLDPGEAQVRVAIAHAHVRQGKREEGRNDLSAIANDERFLRHVRDRALEEMGDLALAEGDTEQAAVQYREVMSRTVDEDQLRTLDVKLEATRNPQARGAVVAFLIGEKGRRPDKVRAAEALARWAESAAADGLPEYLLARGYVSAGDFFEAQTRLDRALQKNMKIPRVVAEAERLRIVTACALSDAATVKRLASSYLARQDVPRARRESLEALTIRCLRMRSAQDVERRQP